MGFAEPGSELVYTRSPQSARVGVDLLFDLDEQSCSDRREPFWLTDGCNWPAICNAPETYPMILRKIARRRSRGEVRHKPDGKPDRSPAGEHRVLAEKVRGSPLRTWG